MIGNVPIPTARRARSTWRRTLSPPVAAPLPSSCSMSPIRSSVCWRPSAISRCTRSSASERVIRPRLTASSTTSWMRSPVSITPLVRASRTALRLARASCCPAGLGCVFGAARLVADARLAVDARLAEVERFAVVVERFAVPCFLGCGIAQAYAVAARASAREQQLEERLLRVAAGLRLVPDRLPLAVEHRLADLLARVRRQAVQRDRALGGAIQQRVVDPVGR